MRIQFTKQFIKMTSSLPEDLRTDVYEKVELFRDLEHHGMLKVYELKGNLHELWSFSVNYKTRIVFERTSEGVILLAVGDHDIYRSR